MDRGSWRIAVLFAAAALGGTYLGGADGLRFFAYFGSWGILGILLVSGGLGWLSYRILTLSHHLGFRSLHDLLCYWFGEKAAPGLSVLLHLLLLAWAGTSLGEMALLLNNGNTAWAFALVPVLVAVFLLGKGWPVFIRGVTIFLGIGLLMIASAYIEQRHIDVPSLGYQLNLQWLVHSLYYFSLHFISILVICLPLASRASRAHFISHGVVLGSLLFFFTTLLMQGILLGYWHDIHSSSLPLQTVLASIWPGGQWIHALAVLGYSGIVLAITVYALASPVALRYDISLTALFVVMMIAVSIFAFLGVAWPSVGYVIASALTYSGLFLVVWLCWKMSKT
ncbi:MULTISPECIES: hypothetical protein [Brevibacillus]|uniref:Uncharacterized protein n=1 Tax=Brevibacillus borstelensis AK1 TaxID=1300222 RepID=M8E3B0_9BACL|nr:hypothetical protein [Brevibacillus borstelensis]EMT53761.1 hypothetical protein I532_07095 [Brevibacillus borstelensis AK1]KKX56830.1 hypothetical protein X546_02345 [Brevibacillus borstelensis cifa_chp40]MBE5394674.1 hypothetical protein [Brevibacillus borstelensis]MED1745969.1 hypothetical protein [Brevibacillus borstelensis]MED1854475.1 hypothetical protein [Brevibacillus borstelensis]